MTEKLMSGTSGLPKHSKMTVAKVNGYFLVPNNVDIGSVFDTLSCCIPVVPEVMSDFGIMYFVDGDSRSLELCTVEESNVFPRETYSEYTARKEEAVEDSPRTDLVEES